jgi:hypothetical protein
MSNNSLRIITVDMSIEKPKARVKIVKTRLSDRGNPYAMIAIIPIELTVLLKWIV